jgi:hypothetical protein
MLDIALPRVLAFCLVLLVVSACGDNSIGAEAEKAAVAEAEKVEKTGNGNVKAQETELSDAAKAAAALIANINEPWTGDYSGMAERRLVRVLLPYSMPFFFHDKGQKTGINFEFLTRFEDFLNGKIKEKKGQRPSRIKVVIVPTPREELLTRLVDGFGAVAYRY